MMDREHCEKEEQVVAALRSGPPEATILDHARDCSVCAEVLLVATRLRQEAALPDHALNALPDAGLIWQAAQSRTREKALAKATLPIRIMRAGAVALAIFAAPWITLEFLHPSLWISTSNIARAPAANGAWLGAFTGTTILGMTATLACIALGSWYMLREK